MEKVSISEAARILGVSPTTLRRWDEDGTLVADRTPAGHRRYDLAQLKRMAVNRLPEPGEARSTVGYARVSSKVSKDALNRQALLLSEYCDQQGWEHEILQDVGSGANYRPPGLRALLRRIVAGQVGRVVLTHHDRLAPCALELFLTLCAEMGVEVVIVNPPAEELPGESDLVDEVQVIAARLGLARGAERIEEILDELED